MQRTDPRPYLCRACNSIERFSTSFAQLHGGPFRSYAPGSVERAKSELRVRRDFAIDENTLPGGFFVSRRPAYEGRMSGYALDGKMRSKLREAILAGFGPVALDEVLRDNDMFRHNIAIGPDFVTRVNSLIDVARQEGWLVELCSVLAAARAGNQPVSSAILTVQRWLIDQRETPDSDLRFQEHAGLSSKPNAARFTDQKQAALEKVSWAEFFFRSTAAFQEGHSGWAF